eukprot:1159667-Pelagomonas_calceolata.AAC.8
MIALQPDWESTLLEACMCAVPVLRVIALQPARGIYVWWIGCNKLTLSYLDDTDPRQKPKEVPQPEVPALAAPTPSGRVRTPTKGNAGRAAAAAAAAAAEKQKEAALEMEAEQKSQIAAITSCTAEPTYAFIFNELESLCKQSFHTFYAFYCPGMQLQPTIDADYRTTQNGLDLHERQA